jgi:hypothetical protein
VPFCPDEKFDSARVLWFESYFSPSGGDEGGLAGAKEEGSYYKVGSSSVATILPSSQVCSYSDGASMVEPKRESGTPSNSSVSMSQLWYTLRVKEKVAKQLNKNKVLIVEVVGVIPVVGEDRVANALNLTPVLGLSWRFEDKKLWDLVEASVPKVKGVRAKKSGLHHLFGEGQEGTGLVGFEKCVFVPSGGALRWFEEH